ncbi:hypothetical protein VaNZ11_004028 [Volvox africanus]|uniref:RRM domain-containing protein n=1 Tax=Volvox africanus TaxID=51714 RepID=A0ABQ5RVP7_9CHLO|nr:hypothetical protein VaNZ11_004028 [Volvox africanus]
MNPLTQIKNTQKATKREIDAGIQDSASWHAQFKHSAYIFTGGLDYELTEGDLLAVFSQYGEIVDLHLIRHKDTGKSKGFAFVAYEDQRSTVLAVDNLNGAKVVGRTVRVEHVDNYKKRRAEVEGEDPGDGNVERNSEADGGVERPNESSRRQDPGQGRHGRSSPPTVGEHPRSSEPWADAGSIFALMEDARRLEAAKQASCQVDARPKLEPCYSGLEQPVYRTHGDVSQNTEQGRNRNRDNGRERDQERDRDWERGRSISAGPAAAPAFGPPRPTNRQAVAGSREDLPGYGPGSARDRLDMDWSNDRWKGRTSPRRDDDCGWDRSGIPSRAGTGPRGEGRDWERCKKRASGGGCAPDRKRSRSRDRNREKDHPGFDEGRWKDRGR